jgi:hypothetical protein
MFFIPDSTACAMVYGEGPDADKNEKERGSSMKEPKTMVIDDDAIIKTKTCKDCGNVFDLTKGELNFYEGKGFQEPERCSNCRRARRARRTQREAAGN